MRGLARISCLGVLLACGCGLSTVVAAPACAQGSYSPYNETPAAALARYVRALADDPKDFDALIGAGRSALMLGDTEAAAGFFARADDVDPTSPAPQEGMGAVQVANGDAKGALPYFTRAQKLGATQAMLGCDRGLAYDMLGEQTKAQADYRAALSGADADEARRRLALSLAIGGNKSAAIAAIAPLAAKGDPTTSRVRAFVLALTGDPNGAMAAVDAAMPGSWSRVAPFLQRLASLPAGEKAAAVNLGIFPNSTGPAYAYAARVAQVENPNCHLAWTTLAGIGMVESHHGTYRGAVVAPNGDVTPPIRGVRLDGSNGNMQIPDTDGGKLDGDATMDRAMGPMQFIPETWRLYGVDANNDGVISPDNIDDAALSAAGYLCWRGKDLATPRGWMEALRAYNHSDQYARTVRDWATAYADGHPL